MTADISYAHYVLLTIFIRNMSLAKLNVIALVISVRLWELDVYADTPNRLLFYRRLSWIWMIQVSRHYTVFLGLSCINGAAVFSGSWINQLCWFAVQTQSIGFCSYDFFSVNITCAKFKVFPNNNGCSTSRDSSHLLLSQTFQFSSLYVF